MTIARRIANLEAQLGPVDAVRRWLDEAHQFGSLPAYARWLTDQPLSAAPLVNVVNQARLGVQGRRKEARAEDLEADRVQAEGTATFLVELVLELNLAIARETDRAEVWLAAARGRQRAERRTLCQQADAWVQATTLIERESELGVEMLFPDLVARWQAVRDALAPDQAPGARSMRSSSIEPAGIRALADQVIIPASVRAYLRLNERAQAAAVAVRMLPPLVQTERSPGVSDQEGPTR